jgi:membrane-bound acyltransferase YfiQ involved in biofilm formation
LVEQKKIVPELFVIRAIACLCVVLLHANGMLLQYDATLTPAAAKWLTTLSALLLFSTPAFAFMSAFLLGFSKRKFQLGPVLWKRVKYLLSPFVFFALVYAAWGSYNWGFPFAQRLVYNLRGGYHGYFVLIVMQFYVAHAVLEPILARVKPKYALATAGVVNLLYLMALEQGWFTPPDIGFNWSHLFPAWLFYYVLGFYAGRYREAFQAFMQTRLTWAAGLAGGAGLVLLYRVLSGAMPDLSSQRFDVLIYATGVICVLFGLAGKLRRVPGIFNVISRYSFGVYLLHWFLIELLWRLAGERIASAGLPGLLGLWAASVACSMALTAIIGALKIGPFLVGKLGISARGDTSKRAIQTRSNEVTG